MPLVERDLKWFVNFAFYRQWELTNISRTSHIVQNLSCDMSFEHKVSKSLSTKPKQWHWWKLDTLEGASVNKAVPTTKGFKVWNKNFWTVQIKNRISVVFSCIYRKKHGPTVESDYSRHPQNSNCSPGTFRTLVWSWTYAVDWQLLQKSSISKEAKDQTFHWLCWHTKTEQKEHHQGSEI